MVCASPQSRQLQSQLPPGDEQCQQHLDSRALPGTRVLYLHDSLATLQGGAARVFGCPVSVGDSDNRAFQEPTRAAMAARVMNGVEKSVVGPAPAAGAGDGAGAGADDAHGHAQLPDIVMLHGDPGRELCRQLVQKRVRVCVYGHKHEQYGARLADAAGRLRRLPELAATHRPAMQGGGEGDASSSIAHGARLQSSPTIFINAATVNAMHCPKHLPMVFDLPIHKQ